MSTIDPTAPIEAGDTVEYTGDAALAGLAGRIGIVQHLVDADYADVAFNEDTFRRLPQSKLVKMLTDEQAFDVFTDWQYAVANGDTRLGLDEWMKAQDEMIADEPKLDTTILNSAYPALQDATTYQDGYQAGFNDALDTLVRRIGDLRYEARS